MNTSCSGWKLQRQPLKSGIKPPSQRRMTVPKLSLQKRCSSSWQTIFADLLWKPSSKARRPPNLLLSKCTFQDQPREVFGFQLAASQPLVVLIGSGSDVARLDAGDGPLDLSPWFLCAGGTERGQTICSRGGPLQCAALSTKAGSAFVSKPTHPQLRLRSQITPARNRKTLSALGARDLVSYVLLGESFTSISIAFL